MVIPASFFFLLHFSLFIISFFFPSIDSGFGYSNIVFICMNLSTSLILLLLKPMGSNLKKEGRNKIVHSYSDILLDLTILYQN